MASKNKRESTRNIVITAEEQGVDEDTYNKNNGLDGVEGRAGDTNQAKCMCPLRPGNGVKNFMVFSI